MFEQKSASQPQAEKTIELRVYDRAIDMSCFSGG